MKFKKTVSIAAAVSLLGSLIAAVPASAEGTTTVTKPTVTAAAQMRGSGGWSSMNSSSNAVKTDVNAELEVNYYSYMGAYYQLEIPKPEGVNITKVTIDFTKVNNIGIYNRVIAVSNPTASGTDGGLTAGDIWTVVSDAMTVTENGTGTELARADSDWSETDITSLLATEGAIAGGTYSIFVYSSDATGGSSKNGNVKYSVKNPVLKVTYDKPVKLTSSGTDAYYSSLSDAYSDASANDTITLLQDLMSSRVSIAKNNLTIDLNGYTLTGEDTSANSSVLELNSSGTNLTIKNGTIKKGTKTVAIEQKSAASPTSLENVTVDSMKINKYLNVTGSSIEKLTTGNIGSSDAPKITADAYTTIVSVEVSGTIAEDKLPYTLFDGEYKAENVTVPEGYTYANGVISVATASAYAATKAAGFDASSDTTNADAQVWTVEVTPEAGTTYTSASWTITATDGTAEKTAATPATLTGGSYKFGAILYNLGEINVTGVSITLK